MTKFFFEYVFLYYTMQKKYKNILKNNHPQNTSIKKILKNTETVSKEYSMDYSNVQFR